MCRFDLHTPQAVTSTTTSPGPGSGSATSCHRSGCCSMGPALPRIIAFMGVLLLGVPVCRPGPDGRAGTGASEGRRGEQAALDEQLHVRGTPLVLAGEPALLRQVLDVLVLLVDGLLVDGRVLLGAQVLEPVHDTVGRPGTAECLDVDH